ncbi:MAG: hypothetical protein ACTHJS_02145, partial [Xanthobacteraceae bacterium]
VAVGEMILMPTASFAVQKPSPMPSIEQVTTVEDPSKNYIVPPLGANPPAVGVTGEIIAVKVTDCVAALGLTDDPIWVVVSFLLTIWVVVPLLGPESVLPG